MLTERLGSPDVKHKINLTVCVHERKSADDFFLLSSSVILNFCATSHFLNVEVLKDAPQEIYINKKSSVTICASVSIYDNLAFADSYQMIYNDFVK